MGDLYATLRRAVPDNARRVVDLCAQELPEYRTVAARPEDRARMLDFAVFMRRRTLELVTNDQPLTEEDRSVIAAVGEERGRGGVPRDVAQRVLVLHAAASVREIQEAAGQQDLEDVAHLVAWLGEQGTVGQQEYTLGFLRGEGQLLPVVELARRFAELALAGDPVAPGYAERAGIRTPETYRLVVVRTAGGEARDDGVLDLAWHRYHAPATWHRPDELAALLPANQESTALAMVREIAARTGLPCAAATATGPVAALPHLFDTARRVSRVARVEPVPDNLHTVADVLLEIGAAEQPDVARWLDDITRWLTTGPDLLPTLDTYYRHDLNRTTTAATLNVHPRTLDYRLRRAHALTGLDPHTPTGIRVFTTAIARRV